MRHRREVPADYPRLQFPKEVSEVTRGSHTKKVRGGRGSFEKRDEAIELTYAMK
jgi:hypothetical protein